MGDPVSDQLLSKLAAARCDGPTIAPGHQDYERARRVWNGIVDRKPSAILHAANVDDIRKAVEVAAACGSLLAVRSGGHSFPGLSTCDNGLLLDLSRLNSVSLNEEAGTVDVGGGALLGDLDRAIVPSGYAVPAGVVSHTGVGGLTLGGGMGWLGRTQGLTIDKLVGAEIVTASGDLLWTDAASDPELFWGIRGGGGNFGVVTRFRFKLSRLGSLTAGQWDYPIGQARRAIASLRSLAERQPREFSFAFTLTASDMGVTAIRVGDGGHAGSMLEPFGQLAGPGRGTLGAMSFLHLQSRNDVHFAWSRRYYAKGGFWRDIDDHAVECMLRQIADAPTPHSEIYVLQLGGAVADVAEDATAYSGRHAAYYWIVEPVWDDPADDERCIAWCRAAADQMADRSIQANYVNEQADTAIAPGAYGARKYERLRHLKMRLDPENLFRLNQNIIPATTST